MPPDTQSYLLFAFLLICFLGLVQLWLWRQDRALAVLGIWGSAHLSCALGLLLLMGRLVLPHRLSIDAAMAIIFLSYAITWLGARRLEGRSVPVALLPVGAIIWLMLCQVPLLYQSVDYRIAGGTLIAGCYDFLAAWEFARKRGDSNLPSRRALALVFSVLGAQQFLRCVFALTQGVPQTGFSLPVAPWLSLSAGAGIVLTAGADVLLIAVAKEEAELRSITAMARARDIADQANVAKSRFLARMSHELRTPLNAMLGMAQALTRDPALGPEQRERAVLLEQGGRHLLGIVNDILDLARAEAGRFKLATSPSLVSEIVQGSVDLVTATASAKSVCLNCRIDDDVPRAVLADPLRMRQVLVNLLSNAIKFSPSAGQVSLSVSRLMEEGGLRFAVTDTGPGVAPDIVPYLFQDFAFGRVTGESTEGAGLGLAISASLVQAMGGTISYRPGPDGIGSVFVAEVPLPEAEPPAAPPRAIAEVPDRLDGVRILVVDDVSSNRRLAEVLLTQAGASVTTANDGAAAVTALETEAAPDVVLMDVYMPGMDGLAATRHIRALSGPAGRVPIIALTADVSPEQTSACREAGMNAHVAKPLDVPELLATIRSAVSPRGVAAEDAGG